MGQLGLSIFPYQDAQSVPWVDELQPKSQAMFKRYGRIVHKYQNDQQTMAKKRLTHAMHCHLTDANGCGTAETRTLQRRAAHTIQNVRPTGSADTLWCHESASRTAHTESEFDFYSG